MHATTVAVDLAKSVFQIAMADDKWHVVEQQRLTRSQFEHWFHNRMWGWLSWKPAAQPTIGAAGSMG